MLNKLQTTNLWDTYLSKNKIYETTPPAMIVLMKNLTNFIQKYVLTSSSTSRVTAQQLYDVLQQNLKKKISLLEWHEAPKPKFIHIARKQNTDIWPKDFFANLFDKCKDVQIYRGGVKQDISPEFIYYSKALCDYYLTESGIRDSNLDLTFAACLLLAGEVTCCDIRRKELMALGFLPESNYEDDEHVIKSRIKKIYNVLQGKLAYIVSD